MKFPGDFFSGFLPVIDDLDELKLILILFKYGRDTDNKNAIFSIESLIHDPDLLMLYDNDIERIVSVINKSINRKSLIEIINLEDDQRFLILNTPDGRAIKEKILTGLLTSDDVMNLHLKGFSLRPNIFRIYEENIGPLTPMISDILIDAEKRYPGDWIQEAIQLSLKRNVRNWNYVQAILDTWLKEGKNGKTGKNNKEDRNQYRKKWLGEGER